MRRGAAEIDLFADVRAGRIQEFFVVSREGAVYTLPSPGTQWSIRLRGREPGRYDADRFTRDAAADFAVAEAVDLDVSVTAVEPRFGPDETAYVEGFARSPVLVRVTAFVRIGGVGMPGGLANVLMQNEVAPDAVRRMAQRPDAPVGSARLVPVHPPEEA